MKRMENPKQRRHPGPLKSSRSPPDPAHFSPHSCPKTARHPKIAYIYSPLERKTQAFSKQNHDFFKVDPKRKE
jgi:hypothetical protein